MSSVLTPTQTVHTAPAPATEDLLVRVAVLLHAYGTPAHRLERLLDRMAAGLEVPAEFLITPTSLLAAFGPKHDQRTHLIRVDPGEVNLGKLSELDELLEELQQGTLSHEEACARVTILEESAPRFGLPITSVAFGVAAAGAAALFGGGVAEVIVAFLMAAPQAALVRVLGKREDAASVFEPIAAALSAFVAMVVSRWIWPLSEPLATLAALIVLVPGLTLTVATIELSTRHLVSGTARLAGAMTTFLMIALGLALGRAVGEAWLPAATSIHSGGLPMFAGPLAAALSPLAFAVIFQARRQEFGWIWVTSVTGFAVAALGSRLSPEVGPFLGALAVGLLSNLYARALDRPALVPLTPGILMLVPGSVGFRALDLFLAQDAVAGTETFFQMAISAVALAGGLLLASALLPPRRTL